MIGEKIHNYIITRLIGEGGMATVYEAVHEKLQTKVAVKVLNPMLAANSSIRKRFENEARFMAGLTHQNITRVIDYEERPDLLAIILEYLEGQDLNVLIKQNGPMSLADTLGYFTQVLDAFDYAHNKGIVHRDVKPSNIIIEPLKTVKILDFGIAKLVGAGDDMTMTGAQMGTPVYMSPEQVNSDKTIDHRSDIYSLGVTLYYMLKGEPPYNTTTSSSFQIYTSIVNEPLPHLEKYPQIDLVIKKATDKDRNNRYQSCAEFRQALISAAQPKKPAQGSAESDKTLIDIPEPVKKEAWPVAAPVQQKPPAEKKEKKEKINPQPGEPRSKKTRNIAFIAIGILGIAIFLVATFYPSLLKQVFNSSKSGEYALLWFDLGKVQFKKEIAPRSYDSAAYYLSQAETLDPDNPDIQFYYGHAIFRKGLKDSSDYSGLTYKTISKASDAFETVIRLEPAYMEDENLNDAYSSLTGIWGALALKYLANNQDDSARIAFKEGRKRGGFSDVSIDIAKNILNSCEKDALLLLRYDIVYFPVLYLQYTENYRADVKPISTGDLESRWYFGYLRNKLRVPVSIGETWFALMIEKDWETQLVTIENVTTGQPFTWWVYGNSAGKLSITDQVILDIVTTNKFAKPVHYCAIFDFNKGLLNLGAYLSPEGMVYKVKPDVQTDWQKTQQIKLQGLRFDAVKKARNPSSDQRRALDIIRNIYLQLTNSFLEKGDRINAQVVKREMEEAIPLSNSPFQIKEIEKIYNTLVLKLDYTDEQRVQKEKSNILEYLQKNNLTGNPSSTGLYYIETRKGTGPAANNGNTLKVHYTGKLLDGTKFDSSYDRIQPFEFELGAGQVIKGWEEGLWLRQAGSKGILIIPYDLGYGSSDTPTLPAYSTLVFEVEIVSIN